MTYILYKNKLYPTFWILETLRIDYIKGILEGEFSKIIIIEKPIYNMLKNLASTYHQISNDETWYGIQ